MTQTTRDELARVYCDCGELFRRYAAGEDWNALLDELMPKRSLMYRAAEGLSPAEARAIMEECCPGYNGFEPRLLGLLPDDCTVFLAREYSVCVYVRPGEKKLPSKAKLNAQDYGRLTKDEVREDGTGGYAGEVRIWWD